MNLDQLARDAAEELRTRTVPDTASRFEDLRRTRTRRSVLRGAAVVVAFLLVGGGLALARADHHAQAPAHPTGPRAGNGAIVSSNSRGVFLVTGHLDRLPTNARPFSMVQFTADGSELVFAGRSGGVLAMNVTTGVTRALAPCHGVDCDLAQLSPDATRLAIFTTVGRANGVEVRDLESDSATFIPAPGQVVGWPRWSPDGRTLLITGRHGLYLMDLDDGGVRLLHRFAPQTTSVEPASWSPDGTTIAFLDPRPVRSDPRGTAWTLTTVRPDGTGLHHLQKLGRCYCVGIAPPAVAWSPDGQQIAVTVIHSGRAVTDASSGGLYVVHPDGTGWTNEGSSAGVSSLAWQPLLEP